MTACIETKGDMLFTLCSTFRTLAFIWINLRDETSDSAGQENAAVNFMRKQKLLFPVPAKFSNPDGYFTETLFKYKIKHLVM